MRKAEDSHSSHSDSSKTDSSLTHSSAPPAGDVDLTKDNAVTPIDLECHIQAERITKILNEAIYKTKLAVCVPELMRRSHELAKVLQTQHLEDIHIIFEQYNNPLFSASLLNMSALEDIQTGDVSLKNRLNPELGHMIHILNSYPALAPMVEVIIERMKNQHAVENKNGPPSPPPSTAFLYLLELEQFREQMVVQMDTTAGDELRLRFRTRALERSNVSLIGKIKEMDTAIKEENADFEELMKQKAETIRKLEQELAFFAHTAAGKLKQKILDSDRQMVLAKRAHDVKREILEEEQEDSRDAYDILLRGNVLLEKNQRARRIKVETQLLSWIQKYDTEMSDKQVELDELIHNFEDEEAKVQDLEVQLDEQNKRFDPLMVEREEEYHAEMAEKSRLFLIEHAARVIQVAWRDTLANRAEKKKLKKMLKKMQLAAEAAERAAELAAKKAEALAKKEEKERKKEEKERQKQAKKEEKEAKALIAAAKAAEQAAAVAAEKAAEKAEKLEAKQAKKAG